MTDSVILDTSYVVGLIDEKDTWHARAKSIEERLILTNTSFVFLDCVVNEVINVIVRRFGESKRTTEIAPGIRKFLTVCPEESITWTYTEVRRLFLPVVELVAGSNGVLNFHDAFIVLIARELSIARIVSFDNGFDKTELKRIKQKSDL